jgi:hypothetical protein
MVPLHILLRSLLKLKRVALNGAKLQGNRLGLLLAKNKSLQVLHHEVNDRENDSNLAKRRLNFD